jgi:hypothetical protein
MVDDANEDLNQRARALYAAAESVRAIYGYRRGPYDATYTKLTPTGDLSKMMGRLFNGTVTGVSISYVDYPHRAQLQLNIAVPTDISLETVQANILRVCQEVTTHAPAAATGKRRLLKLELEEEA